MNLKKPKKPKKKKKLYITENKRCWKFMYYLIKVSLGMQKI